jgi:hypothetical protein
MALPLERHSNVCPVPVEFSSSGRWAGHVGSNVRSEKLVSASQFASLYCRANGGLVRSSWRSLGGSSGLKIGVPRVGGVEFACLSAAKTGSDDRRSEKCLPRETGLEAHALNVNTPGLVYDGTFHQGQNEGKMQLLCAVIISQ